MLFDLLARLGSVSYRRAFRDPVKIGAGDFQFRLNPGEVRRGGERYA